jgi:predicted nucleotidyltransferase component of viral defense system
MIPSREFVERAAAQTGFQLSSLEKVIMLGDLAGDIARHPLLKDGLILKGGTALNLGFGPPSRLSVDLDFNYIGHLAREKMLEDRPQYEEAVIDLVRKKGFLVQQSADAFAGRKIFCTYQSVLGPNDRVEIDLNYLFRLPIGPPEYRELWQPGEIPRPRLRVVDLTELFIGKFLAAIDRVAVRDIWDIGQIPRIAPNITRSRGFRARFIALSAILDHPLSEYSIERIKDRLLPQSIETKLLPMLNSEDIDLVDKSIQKAFDIISSILVLSDDELKYVNAVAEGELHLEYLFPDNLSEAERLANHPALLWKIHNVQQEKKKS